MTPVLEELSEFEVELPARCRPPRKIYLVEPIPDIHAQRSERAQCSYPEPKASEQPRGIELAGLVPNIAAFEESVQVERLADSQPELARSDEIRVAERRAARLQIIGVGVETVGSDGK